MKVLIVNESSVRAPRRFIQQSCDQIEKEFRRQKLLNASHKNKELTVVFQDARHAKKANLQFRSKDYATDVLSFEAMDEESYGELLMCPQVLQRQAKEHGLNYQEELLYMLLHGILHLLGYDHERGERDAAIMFAIQDKVFAKLLK